MPVINPMGQGSLLDLYGEGGGNPPTSPGQPTGSGNVPGLGGGKPNLMQLLAPLAAIIAGKVGGIPFSQGLTAFGSGFAGGKLKQWQTQREQDMDMEQASIKQVHKVAEEVAGLEPSVLEDPKFGKLKELLVKYRDALSDYSPGKKLITANEARDILHDWTIAKNQYSEAKKEEGPRREKQEIEQMLPAPREPSTFIDRPVGTTSGESPTPSMGEQAAARKTKAEELYNFSKLSQIPQPYEYGGYTIGATPGQMASLVGQERREKAGIEREDRLADAQAFRENQAQNAALRREKIALAREGTAAYREARRDARKAFDEDKETWMKKRTEWLRAIEQETAPEELSAEEVIKHFDSTEPDPYEYGITKKPRGSVAPVPWQKPTTPGKAPTAPAGNAPPPQCKPGASYIRKVNGKPQMFPCPGK